MDIHRLKIMIVIPAKAGIQAFSTFLDSRRSLPRATTRGGNDIITFLLLGLLIVLFLNVSCATTRGGKFQNLFEDDIIQNRESIKHGSIPKAVSELNMLLEMDPKNEDARFLRAGAYQKLEHYNKAVDDYNELLKYHSNNSKAHYNLGMIYAYKIYEPEKALKHFDTFITLNPNDSRTYSAAKIMVSIDKPEESNQGSANLKEIIGEMMSDRGVLRAKNEADLDKRKKIINDLIKSSPSSYQAHFAMGKTLEEEGKFESAVKSYETALEIKPTFSECHKELGKLLGRMKNKEADIHLIKASLFKPIL